MYFRDGWSYFLACAYPGRIYMRVLGSVTLGTPVPKPHLALAISAYIDHNLYHFVGLGR